MSEYNMTHTGQELDAAIEKVKNGYILPSGTKNITANGTHDVKNFQNANVNVPVGTGTSLYVTKYASGSYIPTSDTLVSSATIPIGFKPKIFILRLHTGTKPISKYIITSSFFAYNNNFGLFSENVPDYSTTGTLNSRCSSYFSTTNSNQAGASQSGKNCFYPTDTGVSGSGDSTAVAYLRGGSTYVYYAWG